MFCFKIGIESNDFRQIWLTRRREKSVQQKSEKTERKGTKVLLPSLLRWFKKLIIRPLNFGRAQTKASQIWHLNFDLVLVIPVNIKSSFQCDLSQFLTNDCRNKLKSDFLNYYLKKPWNVNCSIDPQYLSSKQIAHNIIP